MQHKQFIGLLFLPKSETAPAKTSDNLKYQTVNKYVALFIAAIRYS